MRVLLSFSVITGLTVSMTTVAVWGNTLDISADYSRRVLPSCQMIFDYSIMMSQGSAGYLGGYSFVVTLILVITLILLFRNNALQKKAMKQREKLELSLIDSNRASQENAAFLAQVGHEINISSPRTSDKAFDKTSDEIQKKTIEINKSFTETNKNLPQAINIDLNNRPNFQGEILLCEDNNVAQHVIKSHLLKVGLDCFVANNGKEAVDLYTGRMKNKEKPFDLIFMDIQMPVMDGLEAADALFSLGCETPIIALTANATTKDREIYSAHGMTKCINKPFTTEEIWSCLYEYFTPISIEQLDEETRWAEDSKQHVKLITSFVNRNQNTYEEISTNIKNGDIPVAYRLAHTIKGLAGLMDKTQLQQIASKVEKALAQGNADNLDQKDLEELGRQLEIVLKEYAPYLKESKRQERKVNIDFDKENTHQLLNDLEGYLKADNAKSLSFVEELTKLPYTEEIIEQINDYEFEVALQLLSQLRKKLY